MQGWCVVASSRKNHSYRGGEQTGVAGFEFVHVERPARSSKFGSKRNRRARIYRGLKTIELRVSVKKRKANVPAILRSLARQLRHGLAGVKIIRLGQIYALWLGSRTRGEHDRQSIHGIDGD